MDYLWGTYDQHCSVKSTWMASPLTRKLGELLLLMIGVSLDNASHSTRNNTIVCFKSSSFLSFDHESYVRQIVPSQCLAQPMAMPLAVIRSWAEQAVSIMGHTSRCCMVCLMPQSQVYCSFENPHFNMFTLSLDRPTCGRNRLSAFQVVQGFSAPAGRCSSALILILAFAYVCYETNIINVSNLRTVAAIAPPGTPGEQWRSKQERYPHTNDPRHHCLTIQLRSGD